MRAKQINLSVFSFKVSGGRIPQTTFHVLYKIVSYVFIGITTVIEN
jgi:hypothetical protein